MTRRQRPRTTFRSVLNNERGVALAFVAVLLVVLLGMAALAVDLGMLFNARGEAQRVADSAALAGASALIDTPGDSAGAVARATQYALRNDVRALGIVLEPGDVDVELSRDRVRVRAYRSTDRGTGLSNLFARILGFNESSVSAVAAAEAAIAGGASCILPFALVDRWWETSRASLASREDIFAPASDIYNPGPLVAHPGAADENTGYGRPDRGVVFRIYPGSTRDAPQPGWYFPVAVEGSGANVYRDAIAGCTDVVRGTVMIDTPIDIEPGRMVGPTDQGFDALEATDPNAWWDPRGGPPGSGGCVKRRGEGDACVTGSPRERPMVLLDPREAPTSSGRQAVMIRNFVGVFYICQGVLSSDAQSCTRATGSDPDAGVWVRFVDYRGVNPRSPGVADGSLLRVLRLVE
ncbi:hypothetical protein BH23GEM11_BH23GEM11_08690 [soil metagenome]